MANPTSVGEQLLRQRPDLVRRTWVPILVRETYASGVKDHSENFQNFIQFGGTEAFIRVNVIVDCNICDGIQAGKAFSRSKATRFGGARPYR